jgi:hypothetical protein
MFVPDKPNHRVRAQNTKHRDSHHAPSTQLREPQASVVDLVIGGADTDDVLGAKRNPHTFQQRLLLRLHAGNLLRSLMTPNPPPGGGRGGRGALNDGGRRAGASLIN